MDKSGASGSDKDKGSRSGSKSKSEDESDSDELISDSDSDSDSDTDSDWDSDSSSTESSNQPVLRGFLESGLFEEDPSRDPRSSDVFEHLVRSVLVAVYELYPGLVVECYEGHGIGKEDLSNLFPHTIFESYTQTKGGHGAPLMPGGTHHGSNQG